MANAEVVVVGPGELPLVAELYNQVYRPAHDAEFFRRRFMGRYSSLIIIANLEGRPVGFGTGFELKPSVFFAWLIGVVPDARRMGVASQLLDAMFGWASEHGYHYVRMECNNAARAILHLAIDTGFNVVGVRWDPDLAENLIIFEKAVTAD